MRATRPDQAEPWPEFAELYRKYVDLVYRYCRHRLGSPEEAEDAASQVFLKAMSAFSARRNGGSVASWLFRIAHNQIIDVYRTRRSQCDLADVESHPSPGHSPEDLALAAIEQDEVHSVLLCLPSEQRRVVELRLVGLDTAEIAHVLGKTQAAVRMTQSRAFARLRVLLTQDASPVQDTVKEHLNVSS